MYQNHKEHRSGMWQWNFLFEIYIILRKLENEVIFSIEFWKTNDLAFEGETMKVSIHLFYGIEINDFEVVGQTALHTFAIIVKGNVLRID